MLTTLGPGAANLMLPMSNAYPNLEPLLAIWRDPDDFPASHSSSSAAARDLPADRALRREDYRPNVLDVVPEAMARCMERPFGVSYLTLSAREALKAAANGQARPVAATPPASAGAREQGGRARVLAAGPKRPLVVMGLGVDPANAV